MKAKLLQNPSIPDATYSSCIPGTINDGYAAGTDASFYDTWFDSMYKKEEQLAKMVSSFAILAIIISCLGVISQAILNTINRTKEIGIRKINGYKTLLIKPI